MSTKSKKAQKEKRKQQKKVRKAANKTLWQERATRGENIKSKRYVKKAKKSSILKIRHAEGPCGNIACKLCDPTGIHKRLMEDVKFIANRIRTIKYLMP